MYIVQCDPREMDGFVKIIGPFVLIIERFHLYRNERNIIGTVHFIYIYIYNVSYFLLFYLTQMVAILTNTPFPVFLEQFSSTLPSNFVFGFVLQPPICPNYVAFIFTHLPVLY